MNPSPRSQQGLTFISILLIIGIAGVFLTVAFKLGPHYMQFMTIRAIMEEVKEDPESKDLSKVLLLDRIDRRLYINDIRSITKKDFKFERVSEGRRISIEYEVVQPLFGNLSALMKFSHAVVIPR